MRAAIAASLASLALLTACATRLAPNPNVDLTGEWRVTAVNGIATPDRLSGFKFSYTPPNASVSLGCNSGGGPARQVDGWLVTGNWIISVALCSKERMRFSRGYDLFGQPLAIESAASDRVRLRNERGSIDLARR